MVQMKKILENFVTNRYKPFSKRPFSIKSFTTGIFGFIFLLCVVLLCIWSAGASEVINNYLKSLRAPLTFLIVFNIFGLIIFNITKLKKYAVVISYISSILFLLSTVAFSACLTREPTKYNTNAGILIFLVWIIGVLVHIAVVSISLKRGSMEIRDKYGDYYTNIVSGFAIVCMFLYSYSDKELFLLLGVSMIVGGLLIVLTFNFPRILPYWRKDEPKKDISVYGNTTKMMKRGKSK